MSHDSSSSLEPQHDIEWLVNQIAHAFRNPVFAALVQTEALLIRTADQPEAKKAADILYKQLKRLENNLNEMLLLGRPARSKPQRVNVAKLVDSVAEVYRQGGRGEAAEIEANVDGSDVEVNWDSKAVTVILERLLDNAVQHTEPPHRVEVRVLCDDPGHVTLVVRDEGDGISADLLDDALLPFFPQHRGRPGLGLAIVDKFVRVLGGQLTIDSQSGAGTEVSCTLPRDAAESGS
jgi:signal transduction histidine kinase